MDDQSITSLYDLVVRNENVYCHDKLVFSCQGHHPMHGVHGTKVHVGMNDYVHVQ